MMLSVGMYLPLTHSGDINRVTSQTPICPRNQIRHTFYIWGEVNILSVVSC